MASLTPAVASSPAGAPSRSKKRPASPGTGGPAKKKKATAPGGSQVMGAGRVARMRRRGLAVPLCACSRGARALGGDAWGVAASGAGRLLPDPGCRVPSGRLRPLSGPRTVAASRLASHRFYPLSPPRQSRPRRGWKVPSPGKGWAPGGGCC